MDNQAEEVEGIDEDTEENATNIRRRSETKAIERKQGEIRWVRKIGSKAHKKN